VPELLLHFASGHDIMMMTTMMTEVRDEDKKQ
jgi:hypothetical protein